MIDVQKQLRQVQPDMPVYDSTGEKIGKVSYVHPGADGYMADWAFTPVDGMEATDIAPAALDELPNGGSEEINERLLQLGFIKIKTGLLSATRYALPDHIARIYSDEVHLSVEQNELLTS